MPEHSLEGIHISETQHAEHTIARNRAHLTAFVGRTLRGPLNTPLTVRSFAEFQRLFGGLWQPSPLSYAVEHFFEQGGRAAVIVRVANAAAPVTLSLRCEGVDGPFDPTWLFDGRCLRADVVGSVVVGEVGP